MGFKNSYSSETYYDESRVPDEKSTILPFFGFSYQKKDGGYYKSYGGGVTITDNGNGTYEAKQNPTHYSWKSTSWQAVFTRDTPPTGKLKELEDQFSACLRDDIFETICIITADIFKTTYIPISVLDYYNRCVCNPLDALERSHRIGCLPGCICILVGFIFSLLESFAKLQLGQLAESILVVSTIISILFFFIASSIIQKKLEYNSLSIDKKKKVREEYLAYMIKQYGEKAGGILQEYAKLKGYDRI